MTERSANNRFDPLNHSFYVHFEIVGVRIDIQMLGTSKTVSDNPKMTRVEIKLPARHRTPESEQHDSSGSQTRRSLDWSLGRNRLV